MALMGFSFTIITLLSNQALVITFKEYIIFLLFISIIGCLILIQSEIIRNYFPNAEDKDAQILKYISFISWDASILCFFVAVLFFIYSFSIQFGEVFKYLSYTLGIVQITFITILYFITTHFKKHTHTIDFHFLNILKNSALRVIFEYYAVFSYFIYITHASLFGIILIILILAIFIGIEGLIWYLYFKSP